MTATVQPASVKLTDAKGNPHYYALDVTGRPMPMEPAQYAEFVKLGGPKAVGELQLENSPHRIDFGRPDTFTHDVQQMAVDKALADIDNQPDAELHRTLDRSQMLADTPPPWTEAEQRALAPRTWDEWNRRAMALQAGFAKLGLETYQIRQESLPTVNGGTGDEPVIEVRMAGLTLATYRGPLVVLERRLSMDLLARARRDEAERLAQEYSDRKRREAAEAIASTPEAKLARQDAKIAEQQAEMDAMRYRLNQLINRL